VLKSHKTIKISMDGKGRWIDNVFIERFWRTLKYDEVYLHAYENGSDARRGIGDFIQFYNSGIPHSSLDLLTPNEVYYNNKKKDNAA
ncbi:transposase, partial [bacterium]|nr:transposase [bacterium]